MKRKPGVLLINGVLPPPYGGIAQHMKTYLPLLAQQGYQVWTVMERFYAPHDYPEYQARGVQVLIPRDKENPGRPFYWQRRLGLYLRYGRWMARRYMQFRESYERVEQHLLAYLPETEALLRRHRRAIDIIHVFDRPWWQGWIGQILAEKYRKKLIISVFGEVLPHEDPLALFDATSEPFRRLATDVLQGCDRIASMTRSCAQRVRYLGLDPQKVYPLSFVSGMEEFVAPPDNLAAVFEQYPLLRGKRVVLFVGQLQARKGPDVLLRAAQRVLAQHDDVLLVIVGPDFGMRAELEQLAQTLAIAERCLFTGAVPQETLRALYHVAEMFVFTTVSPIECLGLVFVQAMYARCPVIAANISGVPEVIRPNENGLLYEPGDVAALRQRLLTLLADSALRERLRAQAFADVTRQFAPEVLLQQIDALYAFDT
ncbi:MAG: glycosyltransferase family 4 protein [Chloroflexi bacterium]|nr:glycosyltransferase family 4 protein [Chloroflexota bacterium]